MNKYLDCWIHDAKDLFHQALAGEPELVEAEPQEPRSGWFGNTAVLAGDEGGRFEVRLDAAILGEGVDQRAGWAELLRETFEAACGELLAQSGRKCRVEKLEEAADYSADGAVTLRGFEIRIGERAWALVVRDTLAAKNVHQAQDEQAVPALSPGLELLLDVELEASLRFGSREMPLGEILDLGPGDVVQLDRHVSEPVDLIVGDKIVARGEVVLVNGNFGLRISEIAAPRKRLESIRCLF
jgi:flagellar motor switch protein FliN/FliY